MTKISAKSKPKISSGVRDRSSEESGHSDFM